jgi:hypothetical protein
LRAIGTRRQTGRQFVENGVGAWSAGAAVGNQSDAVAARGLLAGEIDDMAEQPADGRAKHVQDVQRLHRDTAHRQNPDRVTKIQTRLGVRMVNKS